MTRIAKGIELVNETPGTGRTASKGDQVVYNARLFLRKGDEVTRDGQSIAMYGSRLKTRAIDGTKLIDHMTVLGKRQPIAAVEKTLYGMQPGGFREVLASPHLCYGETGVPDLIPANAMLRIRLWVQDVRAV